jgi:hypothetical protein
MTLSHAIRLLGLSGTVSFCFSSLQSPDVMLHFSHFYLRMFLCGWNSIPYTEANKLERFQQKFACVCRRLLLNHLHCKCTNVLDKLTFYMLYVRRHRLETIFLIAG